MKNITIFKNFQIRSNKNSLNLKKLKIKYNLLSKYNLIKKKIIFEILFDRYKFNPKGKNIHIALKDNMFICRLDF